MGSSPSPPNRGCSSSLTCRGPRARSWGAEVRQAGRQVGHGVDLHHQVGLDELLLREDAPRCPAMVQTRPPPLALSRSSGLLERGPARPDRRDRWCSPTSALMRRSMSRLRPVWICRVWTTSLNGRLSTSRLTVRRLELGGERGVLGVARRRRRTRARLARAHGARSGPRTTGWATSGSCAPGPRRLHVSIHSRVARCSSRTGVGARPGRGRRGWRPSWSSRAFVLSGWTSRTLARVVLGLLELVAVEGLDGGAHPGCSRRCCS